MMNIVIIVIVAITLLAYIYNLFEEVLAYKRYKCEQQFVSTLAEAGCRVNKDTGEIEWIPCKGCGENEN